MAPSSLDRPRKSSGKSKVTNGTRLIPRDAGKIARGHVDARSKHMRRFKDVFLAHIGDLGGDSSISEAERSIARRAATLTILLERMEFDFALEDTASPFMIDQYQRVAGCLRRLLESLGLKRRSRDVTPSLSEYLASKAAPRRRPSENSKND